MIARLNGKPDVLAAARAHFRRLAVTARALREERESISKEGFDGYLAKPVEIEVLLAEMRRCLPENWTRCARRMTARNRCFAARWNDYSGQRVLIIAC